MNFLGSGFPLFYNFILYCTFILFLLLMFTGGYSLVTNYLGKFCDHDEADQYKEKPGADICHKNWAHVFSLANKKDMPEYYSV